MSESILDHGYIAEEHAPDPVMGHGDPTPPGKIGIWLFLASEIMFFIGILGTYIVLRSGYHTMFEQQGKALSKPLAALNTCVLLFSSLTMALAVDSSQKRNQKKTVTMLALTFLCACGFMVIKGIEYSSKFHHWEIVTRQGKFYDAHLHSASVDAVKQEIGGHEIEAKLVGDNGDRTVSVEDAEKMEEGKVEIGTGDIHHVTNYGPWFNIFYACYFTLTGVHGLHVLGGMIPIMILLVQAMRGRLLPAHTEYVGLYWHFVDLVWIFLFPLLYLI